MTSVRITNAKVPFGGLPSLPEYQVERAPPSDRSCKSTIADPKLENVKWPSPFTIPGGKGVHRPSAYRG